MWMSVRRRPAWSEWDICLSFWGPPRPLLLLGAWRPGEPSSHTDLRHPRISIFTAVRGFGCSLQGGLIMHGLGKTERGEQGRDLDLSSLRSTMPASGPLQVSALLSEPPLLSHSCDMCCLRESSGSERCCLTLRVYFQTKDVIGTSIKYQLEPGCRG